MHDHAVTLSMDETRLGAAGGRAALLAVAVGVIGLAAGAVLAFRSHEAAERFFHAYLFSFCFCLSLSLGAMFFVLLQHVCRAGWSVVVRRLAEAVADNMLLLAVLALPIIGGMSHLYEWTHADVVARDHALHEKQPYLNSGFFVLRLAVYFIAWVVLARFYARSSIRQDAGGDPLLTLRMQRLSSPALFIFALTTTFASFDLLMSLDPHWYSTIFGVYYFAGSAVGFFALLAVMIFLLQRAGRLTHAITAEHLHDVGKLVFAFTVFWAYIAFSQYLLIWYANIPEETIWYLRRQSEGWAAVGLLLLFGHFVVPFLVLMARRPKRRPLVLAACTVWVLLMHALDLYWLVVPKVSPNSPVPHLVDLACLLGVGGLFTAATILRLGKQSLVPLGDPRLGESLAFENV